MKHHRKIIADLDLLLRLFARQHWKSREQVYRHEARGSTPGAAGYLDDGVQIRYVARPQRSEK